MKYIKRNEKKEKRTKKKEEKILLFNKLTVSMEDKFTILHRLQDPNRNK
jgi:hypothetical protein